MSDPLVTVVCLSYNHEKFVEEAITSVLDQSYQNLQIIVVDDASTDNSQSIITRLAAKHPQLETILLEKNMGNCRAFNKALSHVRGEFVIDFATDDVMTRDRVEKQVRKFSMLDSSYGVVFSDAVYIDESGRATGKHFEMLRRKRMIETMPEGNVYSQLLRRYFVSSPTMMVRTSVMRKLNGYDESLSYEDFDFWIRSSRSWKYAYLDEPLTKVRKLRKSMSTGWYRQGDKQLHSTYLVCLKATILNESKEDELALLERLRYELRQSVFSENHEEAKLFFRLLRRLQGARLGERLLILIDHLRLPLRYLRNLYHRLRY